MANTYDVGDLITTTGTWTDTDDDPLDPTAVFFSFRDPSGNVTSYTYGVGAQITKTSTGIYTCNISIDKAGTWYYRWYATGTGQAAQEDYFLVWPQRVTSS